MSRGFRFSRSTIIMMVAVLVAIFIAIEKARDIQIQDSGTSGVPFLPAAFVTVFAFTVIVGAAAYGLMFALKRSGVHRLSDVHAPRQK